MTLIFIYNARSGKLNSILDSAHKILSPNTYSCPLCKLTHNSFSENKTWKEFRSSADIEMEFYHLDEFQARFEQKWPDYPVILKNNNGELVELISKSELVACHSAEELINEINKKNLSDRP